MEDLQEKIDSLTCDKEARYFYHITSGEGNDILENGLVVASSYWEESFLEFTDSELANIASVIEENKSNKIKQSHTIILAGVYEDGMDSFIRRLNEEESYDVIWEGVGNPDYIVDSEHLMGYIDLDTLELVVNDKTNVYGDYIL